MPLNQNQMDIMTEMRNVQNVNRNLISTVLMFLSTEDQQKEFLAFLRRPERQTCNTVLDKLEELTGCCNEHAKDILR